MMPTPPPDIPLWWYWTAMSTAALIIGVAKSGFGGGIGILAIPLVANTLPPDRALAVLLPILIAADTVAFWQHRGRGSRAFLRPTLGGACLGLAAGFLIILALAGEQAELARTLKLIVGFVCLGVLALQVVRIVLPRLPRLPASGGWKVGAGFAAGVISMLAHAAGPVMTAYLLEQRLGKRVLVATLVVFFYVVNVLKVPAYVWMGWLDGERFVEALVLCLFVPIGSALGLWMHRRIPERPFTLIVYAAASVGGVRLIATALTG